MYLEKPIRLNSLGLKILFAYVIGVILSIMLVILLILWLLTYRSSFISAGDLSVLADDMAKKIQYDPAGKPIDFDTSEDDLAWIFDSLKQETAYRVLDKSGNTVMTSAAGETFWLPKESTLQLTPGHFEFVRDKSLIHGETMIVEHGQDIWYLQFGVSARFFNFMHQGTALPFMGMSIISFSVVLLLVFGMCAYVTLGYTLRPLRKVSESAAAISPHALHARLRTEDVPAEIVPLVESFNRALDRLEQGYRIQQDFLATAAHELKTPLALIRAQIEVKDVSEDREALLNDVAHMTRQVQQLLLLAEVSEQQNYKLTAVDVPDLVADVVTYLQPMAQAAGVEVTVTHGSVEPWQADRSALFILLKNLLENALQHAPRGTEICVEIDTHKVTVRDSGPGVDQEELSKIFVRFWRGAHRRDQGAGLGLSICQEIATAHNWTLSAHRAASGMYFQLTRTN